MTVQAKFKCHDVHHIHTASPGYVAVEVRMVPVWEEDGKNRQWSKATPSGELKMMITNPPAAAEFELGVDYLLTFQKSDAEAVVDYRDELERAYRALRGLYGKLAKGEPPDQAMLGYHAPTIAAALRFVNDGKLDGSAYFIGKDVSVLHEALAGA